MVGKVHGYLNKNLLMKFFLSAYELLLLPGIKLINMCKHWSGVISSISIIFVRFVKGNAGSYWRIHILLKSYQRHIHNHVKQLRLSIL